MSLVEIRLSVDVQELKKRRDLRFLNFQGPEEIYAQMNEMSSERVEKYSFEKITGLSSSVQSGCRSLAFVALAAGRPSVSMAI
jgi:hypothetical protein